MKPTWYRPVDECDGQRASKIRVNHPADFYTRCCGKKTNEWKKQTPGKCTGLARMNIQIARQKEQG
jgi:hypothetical protein